MTAQKRSQSTIGSLRWNLLSQIGVQVIRAVTTLVLSMLLLPQDFGLMAMVLAVSGLVLQFVDLGMGQALMQKPNLTSATQSSVFYANLAIGTLAAVATYGASYRVALLYGEPRLQVLIEAGAPSFIIASLAVVQSSLLQREMRFRAVCIIRTAAALVSAGVSVPMAATGYGVWALIGGLYADATCATTGYWLASRWRPRMHFRLWDLGEVSHFSLNLTAHNVFNYLLSQADSLIISRWVGTNALGYYSLAKRIALQPCASFMAAAQGVFFIRFSRLQADVQEIRRRIPSATAGTALFLFPFLIGTALVAEPLIVGLAGSHWRPVAPVIALLAPIGMIVASTVTWGAILRAQGRTDLLFRWGAARDLVQVGGYVFGAAWGLHGIVAGAAVAQMLMAWPLLSVPLRMIEMGARPILHALRSVAFACAVMAILVWLLRVGLMTLALPDLAIALSCIILGAGVYSTIVIWLRPPELTALGGIFAGREDT